MFNFKKKSKMVFDFKFEVNDALASQAIREAADVVKKALENSSEMGKNFSVQGFLNTLGNIVKPIIAKEFQSENENTSSGSIMPVLLGMLMGNNGFSPDSPSAAKVIKIKDDSEKPTPENPENSEK